MKEEKATDEENLRVLIMKLLSFMTDEQLEKVEKWLNDEKLYFDLNNKGGK
jgi:hypothetical protein